MKTLLTASAIFSTNRWKINVQKDGIRKSFYSSTPGKRGKAEAEAKAIEWLESQSLVDPIFSVAWEQYLVSRGTKVGTSGKQQDLWAGKLYLLPALEKKKLSKITVQDWQDILDKAVREGKAKATINNLKARMTGFRKFCLKKRWPVESMELLENNSSKKLPKRVLTQDAIKLVFSDCSSTFNREKVDHDHCWNAYRLSIVYGFRRGEVCGIKWEDIDGEWLTIKRAINRYDETTNGKNENARRTVKLTSLALNILADQKAYLKSEGIISPWVFPDPLGDQIKPVNLYHAWCRYLAYHDIPHISFHELRHTMISYNKKMPRELLKAVVGHSSDMDTFGVYGHVMKEDLDEAAEDIDRLMATVLA